MDELHSTEWWRWKLYRLIADFLFNPTDRGETHIKSILRDYRRFPGAPAAAGDEHDRAMDSY